MLFDFFNRSDYESAPIRGKFGVSSSQSATASCLVFVPLTIEDVTVQLALHSLSLVGAAVQTFCVFPETVSLYVKTSFGGGSVTDLRERTDFGFLREIGVLRMHIVYRQSRQIFLGKKHCWRNANEKKRPVR